MTTDKQIRANWRNARGSLRNTLRELQSLQTERKAKTNPPTTVIDAEVANDQPAEVEASPGKPRARLKRV